MNIEIDRQVVDALRALALEGETLNDTIKRLLSLDDGQSVEEMG